MATWAGWILWDDDGWRLTAQRAQLARDAGALDRLPVADKKLQWIDGTTARFDGYLEFQRRPQPMLDWFAQYMS
jgi:hypothetical protein